MIPESPLISLDASRRGRLAPLWQIDEELDEEDVPDIVAALAELVAGDGPTGKCLPLDALSRVRDRICAAPQHPVSAAELERVSGLDRWSMARAFRRAYGVSPTRFRTMRQLAIVCSVVRSGESLAAAAVEAGFADQSHMTRKFRSAFGVTPSRWREFFTPADISCTKVL